MKIIDNLHCPPDYYCQECKNYYITDKQERFCCTFAESGYNFDYKYQPVKHSLENQYRLINYYLPLGCDKYEPST